MGARFFPLQLTDSSLFGVRLDGSVGRVDRKKLKELATKCLANGKTKVILDFSDLSALSGGGATELADFQRKLADCGGEAVFVGASETVRLFLNKRFENLPLRFFDLLEHAESHYGVGGPAAAEATPATAMESPPADLPTEVDEALPVAQGAAQADDSLDTLLGTLFEAEGEVGGEPEGEPIEEPEGQPEGEPGEQPEGDAPAAAAVTLAPEDLGVPSEGGSPQRRSAPPTARAGSPAGGRPGADTGDLNPAACWQYLSVPDAIASLRKETEPAALGTVLCNLLHSHDLAAEVVFCFRHEDNFVDPSGRFSWPVAGELARSLAGAERPLTFLDVPADGLETSETKFLSEVQPDLILPVISEGELRAAAFLQNGPGDHDYSVSENFALELLMRLLTELAGQPVARSGGPNSRGGPGTEADVQAPAAAEPPAVAIPAVVPEPAAEPWPRLRQLLRLTGNLLEATEEDAFWTKFWGILQQEVSASSFVILEKQGDFGATACFGLSAERVAGLSLAGPTERKFLQTVERPVAVDDFPAALAELKTALEACGINWLIPLQEGASRTGLGLMAIPLDLRRGETEVELLSLLFQLAARLLGRLRGTQRIESRSLAMVETLVSLMEKRHYGTDAISRKLVTYVRQLAQDVGFPPEQERDLVYGALLRDIGLAEMGEPVITNNQKMSESQWEQLRSHPESGLRVLETMPVSQTIKDVVLNHHERFNGEGFPSGLSGREIPFAARIVAVVENFVAMLTPMPQRPALPLDKAMEILRENFGERYDPDIVQVFLQMLEEEQSKAEAKPSPVPA